MTKRQAQRGSSTSSLVFVALSFGLMVSIFCLRTLPASDHLTQIRNQRRTAEISYNLAAQKHEKLSALSDYLETDPQTVEAAMRRLDLSRPGETRLETTGTANR